MMDVAALTAFLDTAQRDVFRLETLDRYDVASDGEDFARYAAGAPGPDMGRKGPWLARLRSDTARGLARRRVHVLHTPLSPYLRYECEWGYGPNAEAGEQIRILDLTGHPELTGPDVDFWTVDDRDVALMRYSPGGQFLSAHELSPPFCGSWLSVRDHLWAAAEPFQTWWHRHPEEHRDAATMTA